jgi:hypothetical protein
MHYSESYNSKLLSDIKMLIEHPDKPIYFPQPIIVKSTPHTELFRCYGCVLTNNNELKVMDAEQEWSTLEASQANVGYLLQTIFQRLKILP